MLKDGLSNMDSEISEDIGPSGVVSYADLSLSIVGSLEYSGLSYSDQENNLMQIALLTRIRE